LFYGREGRKGGRPGQADGRDNEREWENRRLSGKGGFRHEIEKPSSRVKKWSSKARRRYLRKELVGVKGGPGGLPEKRRFE